MSARRSIQKRRSEAGIALLIAIFVLLLISVMAIALIVSSGTESALAGNYRSSTGVYYAAVAGLEEVRARLRSNNPNSFKNTAPGFLPPSGTPLAVCSPVYVINPVGGEAVAPWDPANAYYDSEFGPEYAGICGPPPSPSPSTLSVWNRSPLNSLPFSGPLYKWVRINGVSERSLNLDTYPAYDGIDSKLVYYDSTYLNDTNSGSQVLEITALAVLPNGSQKLLQYLAAPVPIALPPFLAALTMVTKSGNSVAFSSPSTNSGYSINGLDQDSVGSCVPGPPIHAVGVFSNVDTQNVINGGNGGTGILPTTTQPNYKGSMIPAPDVQDISGSFPANLQSPAGLEALAQVIMQSADVTITPPGGLATGSSLPTGMYSPSPNPMTVVVKGDLDLSGWNQTGYGLLLVRGYLNYSPAASWDGIVMVVGKGTVTGTGTDGGSGEIDGAVFVARTLDDFYNLQSPNLGKATMSYGDGTNTNMGGVGIRYSSCWIQASLPTSSIKILSFHEIAQ